MTSLYNIMTSYTIEQLENQLSERQPSSLLIITKNFSLFVTNFKKSVQMVDCISNFYCHASEKELHD